MEKLTEPRTPPAPTCHVCAAIMQRHVGAFTGWKCSSCGATTGVEPALSNATPRPFVTTRPCSYVEHAARIKKMLEEGLHDGKAWKAEAHDRYAELEAQEPVGGTVSSGMLRYLDMQAAAGDEWSVCPRCEGSGGYSRVPGLVKPCAVCNGNGRIDPNQEADVAEGPAATPHPQPTSIEHWLDCLVEYNNLMPWREENLRYSAKLAIERYAADLQRQLEEARRELDDLRAVEKLSNEAMMYCHDRAESAEAANQELRRLAEEREAARLELKRETAKYCKDVDSAGDMGAACADSYRMKAARERLANIDLQIVKAVAALLGPQHGDTK